MKRYTSLHGFTLVEIMVTVGILALLSAIVFASSNAGSAKARDAERLSDIRSIENALERYRLQNGRYPAGCNDPTSWNGDGNWSGEIGSDYECPGGSSQYIIGLAPEFIPTLPTDPKRDGSDAGYVYTVDQTGSVYKFMALNTVESESVGVDSEFHRCGDRNDTREMCSASPSSPLQDIPYNTGSIPASCDVPQSQLANDYAVSSGFAPYGTFLGSTRGRGNDQEDEAAREYFTDRIRCK